MSSSNVTILNTTKHILDSRICSSLTDDLRKQYGRRSARVVKGDTVKVMRGEYAGIEGKVEKVNTERGTLAIEGVQREKIRGGNVKVQIHASNVTILSLNLQDKYRQTKLQNLEHNAKGDNRDTKLKRRKSAVKKRAEKKEEDKI